MKQIKDSEYQEYQQYVYNRVHGYIWTPATLDLICDANNNNPEEIGKQILEMRYRMRNEQVSFLKTDKHRDFVVRTLRKGETKLLDDFLYEAIFVPSGSEPPDRDIINKPELQVYVKDFGKQKGDNCLVADLGGKVVGAVWTRIMDDYGHIDDETPSFAISVHKEYRQQGIGSRLMVKMLELLKWQGYSFASLAVQKENYALKLYRDIGFETVSENDTEYIMVYEL